MDANAILGNINIMSTFLGIAIFSGSIYGYLFTVRSNEYDSSDFRTVIPAMAFMACVAMIILIVLFLYVPVLLFFLLATVATIYILIQKRHAATAAVIAAEDAQLRASSPTVTIVKS